VLARVRSRRYFYWKALVPRRWGASHQVQKFLEFQEPFFKKVLGRAWDSVPQTLPCGCRAKPCEEALSVSLTAATSPKGRGFITHHFQKFLKVKETFFKKFPCGARGRASQLSWRGAGQSPAILPVKAYHTSKPSFSIADLAASMVRSPRSHTTTPLT